MKLLLAVSLVCFAFSLAHGQTTWTGAVDTNLANAGNWDNGLPTNDGTNDGIVPTGSGQLTGSPINKNINFQGDSGYVGADFGGGQANGFNVTFDGTGDADFTGNGLFLAWDGGAGNDSSFTWNSTGTANTTRWFTSRFGMGTFTQSAGTINQNNTGNFDMIMGEFGAPQDPTGGTTYVMTGGTLNSSASEFEPRFGSMDMSGGTINANIMKWDEGRGGSSFTWNFSGGTINVTDIIGFNNNDALNFTAGSTGVLNVTNVNYSVTDAEADINAGRITLDGAAATPADFSITVVGLNTEIKLSGGPGSTTTFTGNVDNDIDNAGNWDNGLPTNDGTRNGIVPDGFTGLFGSPQDKIITFQGASGYTGNGFNGADAGGFSVTFEDTSTADFTAPGLEVGATSTLEWASSGSFTATAMTNSGETSILSGGGTIAGSLANAAGATFNWNSPGTLTANSISNGGIMRISDGTVETVTDFTLSEGSVAQSGGVVDVNGTLEETTGSLLSTWDLADGQVNADDLNLASGLFEFDFVRSNGTLNGLNAAISVSEMEDFITSGAILFLGAPSPLSNFVVEVVDLGGTGFTQVRVDPAASGTIFTGAVNTDINNAGNWSNGLPTNDGNNDGIVPDGFPALTGNPRDKNITFEGNSGFSGNNFGNAEANGYNVTFNGTGDADFTGNGLFLAWDAGAGNDSSFTWNSTGTANTTRWFTSRFGMGTFTQSAGTINQNNTGNFDMIMGEFGAPQDPAGGTTYVMTGGTLNSLASEFEPRFGTMDMSGGTINANILKWDEGRGGSTFVWNFSGGTINVTDLTGFNNDDRFNFTAGSTGILNVVNANYSIADAEADINAGWITVDGAAATPADFTIELVNIEGTDYTQISTGAAAPLVQLTDVSSNAATNMLGISWTSAGGKLYNVRSSADPENDGDPATWPIFGGLQDLVATPPENTETFALPAESTRLFVVEVFDAPPVTVFSDDFEGGQGSWTVGSVGTPGTVWELGSPMDDGIGPISAFSGTNCWGTDLDANYTENVNIWLRSPEIDLTGAGGATLSYWEFKDIELMFDFGRVAVLDAADDSEIAVITPVVEGASVDWTLINRAIPAAALDKVIKIEFRLDSDEFQGLPGWYLDEFRVTVP